MESVKITNYDELMRKSLAECDKFLNGKDEAVAKLNEARIALEEAEQAVAEYEDADYVSRVIAYRDELKSRLGIVDVVEEPVVEVSEAQDEQNVVETAPDAVHEVVSLIL